MSMQQLQVLKTAVTATTSSGTAEQTQPTLTPVTHCGKLNTAKSTLVAAASTTVEATYHNLRVYADGAPIEHLQCPLTWWVANKDKYPVIACCIVSERLCSKGGSVITP